MYLKRGSMLAFQINIKWIINLFVLLTYYVILIIYPFETCFSQHFFQPGPPVPASLPSSVLWVALMEEHTCFTLPSCFQIMAHPLLAVHKKLWSETWILYSKLAAPVKLLSTTASANENSWGKVERLELEMEKGWPLCWYHLACRSISYVNLSLLSDSRSEATPQY